MCRCMRVYSCVTMDCNLLYSLCIVLLFLKAPNVFATIMKIGFVMLEVVLLKYIYKHLYILQLNGPYKHDMLMSLCVNFPVCFEQCNIDSTICVSTKK